MEKNKTVNTTRKQIKPIILSDAQIVKELCDFIQRHADADTIAWIADELFGGECFYIRNHYEFTPNDKYAGQFDPR